MSRNWVSVSSVRGAGTDMGGGPSSGGNAGRPAFHAPAAAPRFSPGNHVVQSQPPARNLIPSANAGNVHKPASNPKPARTTGNVNIPNLDSSGLADIRQRIKDGSLPGMADVARSGRGTDTAGGLDAFKGDYPRHLTLVLPLLRPGGAVAIDNVLLSGTVAPGRPAGHWSEEDVLRMRAFNADLMADQGITATVLPVGDGVAVAVRR